MLQLLFYMIIGIVFTMYKLKELKRHEIILTAVFWPIGSLLNFIRLVDHVKNQKERNY